MQKALSDLPAFQAKQPPDFDIENLLAAQYDKKMQDLKCDRSETWGKALPALAAGYTNDLNAYNKAQTQLLSLLDKALSRGDTSTKISSRTESPMEKLAWEHFVALLAHKNYPIVLSSGEGTDYDSGGSWTYHYKVAQITLK